MGQVLAHGVLLVLRSEKLPGDQRSWQVLGVQHGDERQGGLQLPDAHHVSRLGVVPRVHGRQLGCRSTSRGLL